MDVQDLLDNSTLRTNDSNFEVVGSLRESGAASGALYPILEVILTSVLTLLIGCWRAWIFDDESGACHDNIEETESESLDEEVGGRERLGDGLSGSAKNTTSSCAKMRHVLHLEDGYPLWLIPIGSSCALLIMFFFFSYVQHILLTAMIVSSVYSLFFLMDGCKRRTRTRRKRIGGLFGMYTSCSTTSCIPYRWMSGCNTTMYYYASKAILFCVSICITVSWLVTGHWILHNIIASSICIAFLSHVRIPSIKTCIILLSLLFFYDIFWVFGSSYIFGDNVMITAAMQRADNVNLANLVGGSQTPSTVELPTKFIFPYGGNGNMMLGCGDVAMPGLLIVSLYMTGTSMRCQWRAALCGYVIGLVAVLVSSVVLFQVAQPALLYIVPCMLLSMYVCL